MTEGSEFEYGAERDLYLLYVVQIDSGIQSTQPLMQWIRGVKRPGRDANHSSETGTAGKNTRIYLLTPLYAFKALCLVKHRHGVTILPLSGYTYRIPQDVYASRKILYCCT
jgi:hypothetical protein